MPYAPLCFRRFGAQNTEGRKAAAKQIIGVYQDRYVRTKDGWRIVERRGKTLFHT